MAGSVSSNDVDSLARVSKVLHAKTKFADGKQSDGARTRADGAKTEAEAENSKDAKKRDGAQMRFGPMLEQLIAAAEVSVDARAASKIEGSSNSALQVAEKEEREVEDDEAAQENERESVETNKDTQQNTQVEQAAVEQEVELEDASYEVEVDEVAQVVESDEVSEEVVTEQVAIESQQVEVEVEAADATVEVSEASFEATTTDAAPVVEQVVRTAADTVTAKSDTASEGSRQQADAGRENYVPTTLKGEGEQQSNAQTQGEQSDAADDGVELKPQAQTTEAKPSETAIRVEANTPTQPQSQDAQPTPVESMTQPDEYVATTAAGDADSQFTHTDAAQPASPELVSPESGNLAPSTFAASTLAAASAAGATGFAANVGTVAGNVASSAATAGIAQAGGVANASGGESANQGNLGDGSARKGEEKADTKPSQADKPRFSRVLQDRQLEAIRQISKAMSLRSAMAQGGRITMMLNPEALGRVQLEMNFDEDGVLSVDAMVEHAGTRHLLNGATDELRVQLRQDNIQLNRFDVQQGDQGFLRDQSNAGNQDNASYQQSGQRAGAGSAIGSAQVNETNGSNARESASVGIGHVNVQA